MDVLSHVLGIPKIGGGGVVYYVDDFDRDDGAVGGAWQGGATWAIASNKLVNTPNLGTESTANGEFTSATTSWSAGNSATLTQRDSATTPGTPSGGADNGCLEVANGGVANGQASQAIPTTAQRWRRVSVRQYSPSANTAASAAILVSSGLAGPTFLDQTTEDAWQQFKMAARTTANPHTLILRCSGSTSGDNAYYDSVSDRELTLSELLNLIQTSLSDATIAIGVTMPALSRMVAGVAANWDSQSNPQNGVLFYVDRTNYYLDKLVAGTWSQVATGSITYSDGALVQLIKANTTYTMFYNGAQVGSPQTISDAGIISNNLHGVFSTDVETLLDDFSIRRLSSDITAWGGILDGESDDTGAFAMAMAATRQVYIPTGVCVLSNAGILSNGRVYGDGIDQTVLKLKAGSTTFRAALKNADIVGGNSNITIENLTVDGNHAEQSNDTDSQSVYALWLQNVDGFTIRNVKAVEAVNHCMMLQRVHNGVVENCEGSASSNDSGIEVNGGGDAGGATNVTLNDCSGHDNSESGMEVDAGATGVIINNFVASGNGSQGIEIEHAGTLGNITGVTSNVQINGGELYGCGQNGVYVNAWDVTVDGVYSHHNTRSGVAVYDDSDDVEIEGCKLAFNSMYGIYANNNPGVTESNNDIHDNALGDTSGL